MTTQPAAADPIVLGRTYRDTISGFEGTAVARHEYLYGCVRIDLEGGDKDQLPVGYVFDEQRLVEAATAVPPAPTATSGGARSSPPRHGTGGRT